MAGWILLDMDDNSLAQMCGEMFGHSLHRWFLSAALGCRCFIALPSALKYPHGVTDFSHCYFCWVLAIIIRIFETKVLVHLHIGTLTSMFTAAPCIPCQTCWISFDAISRWFYLYLVFFHIFKYYLIDESTNRYRRSLCRQTLNQPGHFQQNETLRKINSSAWALFATFCWSFF